MLIPSKKMHEAHGMGNGATLKVLLFSGTGWFRHPDIPIVNGWIVRLGANNNMQIDVSGTGNDISKEKLSYYDVLLFNNANVLDKVFKWKTSELHYEEWYKAGGASHCWFTCIVLVASGNWPLE